MKTKLWLAATAAIAIATPAFADKEDRILLEQAQAKVLGAKNDPQLTRYGGAQLDEAQRAINDLRQNLDNDDAKDARNIMNRIDALVEAAQVRARTAALKEQVATAQTRQSQAEVDAARARAEAAEREAAAARSQAQAAQQQANTLRNQLRDFQLRQTAAGAQLVLQDVIFETGKATLRPGATARMQPLVAYLNGAPSVRVRIDGHTDSVGGEAYNQRLSESRAAAVRSALVAAGVDAARIETVGHGETKPVATNATAAGRQANRRVELTMLGQQLDQQIASQ
jgi:outer membrane protein OmpA-like peptidoglycan-associated protein